MTTSPASEIAAASEGNNTLRQLLGRNAVLLSLDGFLRKHVPACPTLDDYHAKSSSSSSSSNKDNKNVDIDARTLRLLRNTMVSPFRSLPCLANVFGKRGQPVNHESLSSVVDHVVGSLVQRREQRRRQRGGYYYYKTNHHSPNNRNHPSRRRNDNAPCKEQQQQKQDDEEDDVRNLLCQGFVIASDELLGFGAQSMRNMPPGILLMQMNHCVEYIKSTRMFQVLHSWVGDNVLRVLLLNCRIFIPIIIDNDNDDVEQGTVDWKGNYLQVAGPPLRLRKLETKTRLPTTTTTNTTRATAEVVQPNVANPLPSPSSQPTTTTTTSRKRKRRRQRRRKDAPLASHQQHQSNCVEPSLQPTATLRKNPLLYSNSYVPRAGLPTNHIFNDPPSNNATTVTGENGEDNERTTNRHPNRHHDLCHTNKLLGQIFDLTRNNKVLHRKRWQRLRTDGVKVCQRMLENHKKCDYARLLEHYCPIPKHLAPRATRENSNNLDLAAVSASFTPAPSVASFVKAVVKRVFGLDVWGSAHNQDCFMKLIDLFVHARRQEHIPNHRLLQGFRTKQMEWLRKSKLDENPTHPRSAPTGRKKFSRSDFDATNQMALRLLRWTLEHFVTPLLSACFHVTESEFTGKRLLYYRKPLWALFRSLSMKKLLKSQYTEITPAEAAMRLERQKMGFSRLRLLPKETGVRPIATLSKAVRVSFDAKDVSLGACLLEGEDVADELIAMQPPGKCQKVTAGFSRGNKIVNQKWVPSTNSLLNDAFLVLRYEYERDLSLFGSGLDGLHHFYSQYRSFIEHVRPRSDGAAQLIFGSVDIRHCFDSINQGELMKIVTSILQERDYCIQSLSQYRPFESMCRLLRLKKNHVCPPEEIGPFHQIVNRLASSSHKTLYAGTGNFSVAKRDQILELINEHLKSHLVTTADRKGSRYLLQSKGVPQGSTLSTLLCNFYYGKIESRLLGHTGVNESTRAKPSEHLVVRQVDDFLFVVTKKDILQQFLTAMLEGDQDLGVQVNEDKTQVSTTVVVDRREGTQTIKPRGNRRSFPWCGMLLNTSTGEVKIDYSRFHENKAGNAISIDRSRSEGEELLLQLKSFVRPRCIPILFDKCINGFTVQQTNLYQMMAFSAAKLVFYIDARGISVESNAEFIVKSIDSTIGYADTLIRSRLDGVSASLDISPSGHKYICWLAFRDVFCRCQSVQVLVPLVDKVLGTFKQQQSILKTCQRALRSLHVRKLLPTDGELLDC